MVDLCYFLMSQLRFANRSLLFLLVQVMKPMLERKRRARINRCLDELKELMVVALQAEGENVSKLEKADILELTVRHLHKLKKESRLVLQESDRFRDGYTHCANEVSKYLAGVPGVDVVLGKQLMSHLGLRLNELDRPVKTPQPQPQDYPMPLTPASSRNSDSPAPYSPGVVKTSVTDCSQQLWRPW